MGDRTEIEWTDASWTPIRARNIATGKVGWFCEHVTEACRFCYAEKRNLNTFFGNGIAFKPGHRDDVEIFLDGTMLLKPLHWKKPRKIFVCSMTDLFADFVFDDYIDRIFAVMALSPQHTFQILTKRPERMRRYISALNAGQRNVVKAATELPWSSEIEANAQGVKVMELVFRPLKNVWLGTSIANQEDADKFVPELLATPAAKRFLSCEPMLGHIHLGYLGWPGGPTRARGGHNALIGARYQDGHMVERLPKVDWVICGGESGPNARPMHPDWARSLCDQCAAADVAYFFKQWGEHAPVSAQDVDHLPGDADVVTRCGKKKAGRLLDGVEHSEFPKVAA